MLINILIIVLGVFVFVKPDLMWKLENHFLAKQGAPTKAYMLLLRLAGIILTAYGLASIIYLG